MKRENALGRSAEEPRLPQSTPEERSRLPNYIRRRTVRHITSPIDGIRAPVGNGLMSCYAIRLSIHSWYTNHKGRLICLSGTTISVVPITLSRSLGPNPRLAQSRFGSRRKKSLWGRRAFWADLCHMIHCVSR